MMCANSPTRVRTLRRPAALALVLLANATIGCATSARTGSPTGALDPGDSAYAHPHACLELWPSVLRLLASKGYPPLGNDRAPVRDYSVEAARQFLTGRPQDQLSNGPVIRTVTSWNDRGDVRYVATGTVAQGGGCLVLFTYLMTSPQDPAGTTEATDQGMQRELQRMLEPPPPNGAPPGAPPR